MSEAKGYYLRIRGVNTVSSLIDLFQLSVLAVNIWHTIFFRLYEYEIIGLLQKCDIVVKKWQVEHQIKAVNKTIAVPA